MPTIILTEEQYSSGILATTAAAQIMAVTNPTLAKSLAIFIKLLKNEKQQSDKIEMQQYDDANMLMDCLLDPVINVPGTPADFKLVEDCQVSSINAL